MSKFSDLKAPLLSRESQKGQMLPLYLVGVLTLLVLAGFFVDTGRLLANKFAAQRAASVGCIVAAEADRRGGSATVAFAEIMEKNGVPPEAYSPNEGSGFDLTKGLVDMGSTWVAAVSYDMPTSLMSLVGIDTMGVLGRARCVGRDNGGLAPIAVRESAVLDSIAGEDPEEYPILGNHPTWDLADKESGTNFRGAVFLHMWCIPANDPNCPDIRVFYPLTEEPPSAQTQKKLVEDCFAGINCSIWPDVGQRLPIVSGTSNKQLCKAAQDGGWQVGDKVVVIVFDGEVYVPDPSYGNWENVAIVGYAVYEITSFEPSANNCNHIYARLASPQIYSSLDEIPNDVILLKSREIQWDYQGAIPW